MKLHSFVYVGIFLCAFFLPMQAIGQEATVRGDVTKDGSIDGRDALQVMKIIKGIDPSTDEALKLGDVFPLPGLNGQFVGDGKLTQEDAEKILRSAVGLVPVGELNADFTGSAPVIDSFEPENGTVGTQVVIFGNNFVSGLPGENAVRFGDIPAKILESNGTRLVTEVPAGAVSQLIYIQTPGGQADSTYEFIVTENRDGVLQLGGNLNPQDFAVSTGFAETEAVGANGQFQVAMPNDRVVLLGAVPKDDRSTNFYSLIIPEIDPTSGKVITRATNALLEVNALTTAKSLIFLCPLFTNENPLAAKYLMDLADIVPEVQELAAVIEKRYSQEAPGIDDPEVDTALAAAIKATLNQLPQSMTFPLEDVSLSNKTAVSRYDRLDHSSYNLLSTTPMRAALPFLKPAAESNNTSLSILLPKIDCDFITFDFNSSAQSAVASLDNNYSPVDWMVTLDRVKISDMPLGINERFLQLRLRPVETTGYHRMVMVAGNLWTQTIDIVYTLIDRSINENYPLLSSLENRLPLEDSTEGVYFIRAYSGALRGRTTYAKEEIQAIDAIPWGRESANYACGVNLVLAAVDVWDLFTGDSKKLKHSLIKKAIKNATRKLSQELPRLSDSSGIKDWLLTGYLVTVEIIKNMATEAPGLLLSDAKKKLLDDGKKLINKANTLLLILDKASSLGRIIERLMGLWGYMMNPYGREIVPGPSPIETAVLVMGDPFTPKITDIAPTEGGPGTSVTIFGDKFNALPGNNFVYLDENQTLKAEVVAIRNQKEMDITIPDGITYGQTYPIILETVSSMGTVRSPQSFLAKRNPFITGLSKNLGFAPAKKQTATEDDPHAAAFNNYIGTSVAIQGRGVFDPKNPNDILVFGNKEYPIAAESDNTYSFVVPPVPPNMYSVFIRFPSLNNRQSLVYDFKVLGAPVLSEVNPTSAKVGGILTLRGDNFGEDKNTAFVQIDRQKLDLNNLFGSAIGNNQISFRLPTTFMSYVGQTMNVYVRTPAGKSNAIPITIAKEIAETVWTPLPTGWSIGVTSAAASISPDGKITLDEAIAFAKGSIYPFSSPWDDQSHEIFRHSYERLNENNEKVWITDAEESGLQTIPGGPGFEGKSHYLIKHYIDGATESVLTSFDSYDATIDDISYAEEGDFIMGEQNRGGVYYSDSIGIHPNLANQEIDSSACAMGNGDILTVGDTNTLRLSWNGITAQNGNTIRISKLIAETGTAITLQGNANDVEGTIISCLGDGLVIENGVRNEIDLSVQQSGKNGIVIRGGGGNIISGKNGYLYDTSISDICNCIGNGILLENTTLNQIHRIIVDGCGTGIRIQNSPNTLLWNVFCIMNTGSGIVLEDTTDFTSNGSNTITCLGNQIGMELRGVNTTGNTIEGFTTRKQEDMTIGRQQHALYIHEGANNNKFVGCQLGYTSSHGVVIEGKGTDGNQLTSFYESNRDYWWWSVSDCQEDGVRIQGGAQGNRLYVLNCSNCQGNGIAITGEGTDFNQIERCAIGGGSEIYHISNNIGGFSGGSDEPCAKWGIYVDGAFNTQIILCTLGLNTLGGISLNNIRSRDDNKAIPVSIEKNTFGYYVPIPEFDVLYPDEWETETGETALAMNNVQSPYLANTTIQGHDIGVQITDVTNALIDSLLIRKSRGISAYLVNVKKSGLESVRITKSASNSIEMRNCEDLVLSNSDVQENQNGCGVYVSGCKNTKFESFYFGTGLAKEGVIIDNSDGTTFQECSSVQCGSHGFVVRGGSTKTVFDRGYADKNSGCGFLFENSSDITLYGSEPRTGLFIFNNKQNGIEVRNCQRVKVGFEGKGVNLVESGEYDILIDGETTDDVRITASMIMANTNVTGGYGVYAKNGKNILIGGYDPRERNNFEFGNYAGVAVEGEKTEVSIINNLMGEIEEMESGTQKWGNLNGILALGKIGSLSIEQNTINANKNYGIWLKDGASNVRIINNQITENGQHGIFIEGAATLGNTISSNSISRNLGKGIELASGGNTEISAPIIQKVKYSAENIRGTANAPDGSIVEVFEDPDDEGQRMIGRGVVYKQGFQIAGVVPKTLNMHATVTDPQGNTSEFGPTFTPPAEDSMSLVYTYQQEGNEDIYLQSPIASTPARLTEHAAEDADPQLSSDGSRILFVSKRSGNADLWTMNNDGTNAKALTTDPAADYDPDGMHPEGKIAFVSERDGNPEIYIQGESSGGAVEEVAYFQGEQSGTFSSDTGSMIGVHFPNLNATLQSFSYYLVYKPYDPADLKWKIFTFENGKPTTQILAEGDTISTEQGWYTVKVNDLAITTDIIICLEYVHPMYPTLGYTSEGDLSRTWTYSYSSWYKFNSGCAMIKAGIAGSGSSKSDLRITNNNAVDRYPSWSPDGTQIAYASNQTGQYEIWIMNADGSSPKQVTKNLGNCIKPAWSPDGTKIAFVSDKNGNLDICSIEIASNHLVQLTETASSDTDPAWSRNGNTLFFASNRESGWEIYSLDVTTAIARRITLSIGDADQPSVGPGELPAVESSPTKRATPQNEVVRIAPLAGSNLKLSADSISAKPGDSFMIPVRVESGALAANLAFDLSFDADTLEWTGISRDGFFQNAQYALNPETFPTYLNQLRANWVKVEGFTGKTAALVLQFTVNSEAVSGDYPIQFTNAQAYDLQLNAIPVEILDGKVAIDAGEVGVRDWMLH